MTPDHLAVLWGARIRSARTTQGISQSRLANMLHTSQANVSRWERGTSRPTDENRVAVADALGLDPDELFSLRVPA